MTRIGLLFLATTLILSTSAEAMGRSRSSSAPADQIKLSQEMFEAISADDLEAVKKVLSKGFKVDHILHQDGESLGLTSLVLTAQRGNAEIAKLLIQRKANVNKDVVVDGFFFYPLTAALIYSQPEVAEVLLASKANVNVGSSRAEQGCTPLVCAIAHGADLGLVRALLDKGADPNAVVTNYLPNEESHNALITAARYGENKLELIRALLDSGAEINAISPEWKLTPLLAFGQSGVEGQSSETPEERLAILKLLLEAGAAPNAMDWKNETFANREILNFWGREAAHKVAVVEALTYVADFNLEAANGDVPLALAATAPTHDGASGLVRALLAGGAKASRKNAAGETPLTLFQKHAESCRIYDRATGRYLACSDVPAAASQLREVRALLEAAVREELGPFSHL